MDPSQLEISQSGVITPDRWNSLVQLVRSSLIKAFSGGGYARTPGGTSLWARPGGDASGGGYAYPWDISNLTGVGDPDESGIYASYTATVIPGLIAGLTADNMLSTFTVAAEMTYWTADCTTDGKAVTYISISTSTAAPDAQEATMNVLPSSFSVLFGITYNGQTYRTIGAGNPTVTPQKVLTTDKPTPPDPGMPAQDNWYIWTIS